MAKYDDIIVGGGSAGVALATRLSADPSRQVLLIEAGPDAGVTTDADRLTDQMQFSTTLTGWGIDATFAAGAARMNYPQGRTMGGGSAVNGAFAVRGIRDDYDRWASLAGDEWSWSHMLRVLCRLESDQDFAGAAHHRGDGPVPVMRWKKAELHAPQQAFAAALVDHGLPWIEDMNAPDASGVGVIPMNVRDGVRMSTALSYLPAVRGRSNLTIWSGVEVTRVVLDGVRATGVAFVRDGAETTVDSTRVILCAGAFQSPTLLMRSGIGPAEHLASHGVPTKIDLPGVGSNLMDHAGTAVFLLPKGDLPAPDVRVCQVGGRYSSGLGGVDDMWLSMWGSWELAGFPEMQAALGGVPAISTLVVGVHDPQSRGTVRLQSAAPDARPAVDFNMLSNPLDVARLIDGLQLVLELAASRAITADYRGIGLLDPAIATDRDALEMYVRSTVAGWYHASGTCRMGNEPDGGAVVSSQLAVHGADNLFVADASIMPTVVRAPTNLTSIAIGERAAELLQS